VERSTRSVPLDGLLVVLQAGVVLVILGRPNTTEAAAFFTQGYPTGVTTAAVITCMLWLAAAALVVVVLVSDARAVLRNRTRSSRGGMAMAAFLMVGVGCLGCGLVRYEHAQFHACCGTLNQAQSVLEITR
jgi:hypothetical protein